MGELSNVPSEAWVCLLEDGERFVVGKDGNPVHNWDFGAWFLASDVNRTAEGVTLRINENRRVFYPIHMIHHIEYRREPAQDWRKEEKAA